MKSNQDIDLQLAEDISKFYSDPVGFIQYAWEWRKPGTPLEAFDGPDKWHVEFLNKLGEQIRNNNFNGRDAVDAIRWAISSGHSTGKSSVMAWIVCWIMSTRPNCQGTVTANTFQQLSTRTWAAIQRWMKSSVTAHWFEIGGERIYRKGHKESWFVSAQTCGEDNSEAFAGQHAATSTSFYIFDESSAVSDKIFEVAEGGLLSGESMIFLAGNPTRNSGKFHRVCFGSERNRWNTMVVDSRDCQIANKKQMEEWITDYGIDSDFCRVRVRGLPPRGSDLQYIDSERVKLAREREPFSDDADPLVVGVDIARGGADSNVIYFRKGNDGKTIPPIKIPGEETRDSMRMVSKLAEVLSGDCSNGVKPAMMFIDGTGIGGPICDRLKQLGHKNVIEIQFSWRSPDSKYANQRAYMWGKMRDWLLKGSIISDPNLEVDLTAPGYHHNSSDSLVLESKESIKRRGLSSPDIADALALTWGQHVGARIVKPTLNGEPLYGGGRYNGGAGRGRRGTPWI